MSTIKSSISLETARGLPDGYVVLDGDYGGICFLVCPASMVKCNEETLSQLAVALEDLVFPGNTSGATVHIDRFDRGEEVKDYSVGEENGVALNTLWLPSWLLDSGLGERIQRVLDGQLQKLDLSETEKTQIKELRRQSHNRRLEER